MIPLIIALAIFAGMWNALMDRTKHKSAWNQSIWSELAVTHWWSKWADPSFSWKNKWKLDVHYLTTKKPRFFLSTTALVFVTDAWHFSQFMWRMCFTAIIIIYGYYAPMIPWELWIIPYWLWDALLITFSYLLSFNIFYDHIFKQ